MEVARLDDNVPATTARPSNRSIPAFLNKLYSMVDDEATNDVITWSESGESFIVKNYMRVGSEILPRYFKHSNFGSFVRQLNMYDFHKVPHLQQGVLKSDPTHEAESLEFRNDHFQRGQRDLLHLIHRKKHGTNEPNANNQNNNSGNNHHTELTAASQLKLPNQIDLNTVLSDIAALRKHQSVISSDLQKLQNSNNSLWSEMIASRERHKRHQETINKIMKFLASVFGGRVLNASGEGIIGEVEDENGDQLNGALDITDVGLSHFGAHPSTANVAASSSSDPNNNNINNNNGDNTDINNNHNRIIVPRPRTLLIENSPNNKTDGSPTATGFINERSPSPTDKASPQYNNIINNYSLSPPSPGSEDKSKALSLVTRTNDLEPKVEQVGSALDRMIAQLSNDPGILNQFKSGVGIGGSSSSGSGSGSSGMTNNAGNTFSGFTSSGGIPSPTSSFAPFKTAGSANATTSAASSLFPIRAPSPITSSVPSASLPPSTDLSYFDASTLSSALQDFNANPSNELDMDQFLKSLDANSPDASNPSVGNIATTNGDLNDSFTFPEGEITDDLFNGDEDNDVGNSNDNDNDNQNEITSKIETYESPPNVSANNTSTNDSALTEESNAPPKRPVSPEEPKEPRRSVRKKVKQ